MLRRRRRRRLSGGLHASPVERTDLSFIQDKFGKNGDRTAPALARPLLAAETAPLGLCQSLREGQYAGKQFQPLGRRLQGGRSEISLRPWGKIFLIPCPAMLFEFGDTGSKFRFGKREGDTRESYVGQQQGERMKYEASPGAQNKHCSKTHDVHSTSEVKTLDNEEAKEGRGAVDGQGTRAKRARRRKRRQRFCAVAVGFSQKPPSFISGCSIVLLRRKKL